MNPNESNFNEPQGNFNLTNNQNLNSEDVPNNLENSIQNDIDTQNDIEFHYHEDTEQEFQSIFEIESKYHSTIFFNKSKLNLPKSKKIYLDPPAVYAFKEIVGAPNQIKKQNIRIEQFLRARIALEKQLEMIGLDIDQNSNQSNNDLASYLADKILSLQDYQIQKSQTDLKDALMAQDVYMQQPDLVSPNNIDPCKESNLICLDELNCTFQTDTSSTDDIGNIMNEICQHYNDTTFDIDRAVNLLNELF